MKILLSIKPEFVAKIFNGEKRVEFRKMVPKKHFDKVLIYESSPTQQIVGWFSVSKIIKGHPDKIWKSCKDIGGIEKSRYYEYCNGNAKIYAFEIKEVHKFAKPINPFVIDNTFTPPQNFAYLNSSSIFFNSLENETASEVIINNHPQHRMDQPCPVCEHDISCEIG